MSYNEIFQLKVKAKTLEWQAKTLERQAKKAREAEAFEKARLKKALQQGNHEGARIYASNAIRKKSESLDLLSLASRIDEVVSHAEAAAAKRQVAKITAAVVRDMNKAKAMGSMNKAKAMESMSLDGVDTFEPPQDQVDLLMKQMAEEANIELEHDLAAKDLQRLPDLSTKEKSVVGEEDVMLAERLRALRPAT